MLHPPVESKVDGGPSPQKDTPGQPGRYLPTEEEVPERYERYEVIPGTREEA